MQKLLDVLIIGAGHNGLTCACYLAAAGLSVRVVERRHVVGGTAVTEEFYPGFRNSTASYTVSLLNPQVIRDLKLAQHGLRIIERPFSNFVPLPDGRYMKFGETAENAAVQANAEVAKFSERDAERLPAFYARLDRVADQLRHWVLQSPPNLGGPFVVEGWRDLVAGARLLLQMGRLPREGQRDLVDVFTKSAGDWLDSWFESEPLKAVLGWDSIVGNYASPYAPGSAYVLLHHVFGEVNGKRGKWGHAIGGMGAITQAMAAEARARGVQIDVEQPVQRVIVENGRATGVELKSGEVVRARAVAANVTPKLLYQRLVDSATLPADFAEAIARTKYGSGTFRINVALSELPDFSALPGATPQPHHASGITFAPSLAYMDRAWHDAVAHGYSREPVVEMLIPSVVDNSLAPPGQHVASLFCQQFAPTADWSTLKERAVQAIFDVVQSYCPNFRASLLGYRALSPADLESEFGLTGGDISTASYRSINCSRCARCSATRAIGGRSPVCITAAPARIRAVASPERRVTTLREKSFAT